MAFVTVGMVRNTLGGPMVVVASNLQLDDSGAADILNAITLQSLKSNDTIHIITIVPARDRCIIVVLPLVAFLLTSLLEPEGEASFLYCKTNCVCK
jgi:hypothetical protein